MKYLHRPDPRFQSLGLKSGMFLALFALLLMVLIGVLAWRQDFFRPMVSFETAPSRAEGLSPGMNVTLHGIRVGRVYSVGLSDDGSPVIRFGITEQAARAVKGDAIVRLSGLDPLGTPFLDIRPGPSTAKTVKPGAKLPFERDLTLNETAAQLVDEIRPIVKEAGEIVALLKSDSGPLLKSLNDLQILMATVANELPPTLEDARKSAEAARVLLDGLVDEDGDIAQVRGNLLEATEELNKSLPSLLSTTEKSLASIEATTSEIETLTKKSLPEVQSLIRSSDETIQKADGLVSDFREIWLLRLFLPKDREVQNASSD